MIKFKGNPLTLAGRAMVKLSVAPDFKVTAQDLSQVSLSDFKDKIKILTSFPSIDTPVCDLQVKEFNKKATGISQEAVVIGISKDLPFAQKRFCETFEIKNVKVLSDYKTSSFGINYGLLIKELNLLARSIVIVDKSDRIRYIQIVEELTTPPDFQAALSQLEEVVKNPLSGAKEEISAHCKPCEGGTLPLPKEKIEKLLAGYRGWELVDDKKLVKEFKFKDFIEAKYFLDLVSLIAEEQGHHPTITITYNKLRITLTTHAVGGLSENDFIIAKIIDQLGAGE
ncbi:MAG: thiol peroxidase [Candidatus Omnitrophica bacterium]|nr:thiol peroxidase [Candidatus Omnitrophota bacterium]